MKGLDKVVLFDYRSTTAEELDLDWKKNCPRKEAIHRPIHCPLWKLQLAQPEEPIGSGNAESLVPLHTSFGVGVEEIQSWLGENFLYYPMEVFRQQFDRYNQPDVENQTNVDLYHSSQVVEPTRKEQKK